MSELIKRFNKPVDLTEGEPVKKIVTFMVPMLVGNIAQQLYNTVDSIVVGKYIGDNALSAVGNAGPIFNLLLVLFVGISVGASIMVSQYMGAKDRENISKAIGMTVKLTAIISVIFMIIGPLISRPLLILLNTPNSIINWCQSYLTIVLIGIAGLTYYNILSGVLRGLGDSISPLLYLLIATAINIALDILFVAKFNMGVSGVALATVIAQFTSALLCLFRLSRMKDIFDFDRHNLKLNKKHVKMIIKLGLPSGLTQMIFSLSMIVLQRLTNSFGEMFIAANIIVMRIDGFAMMPNFSFGNAMSTYSGQNVGARRIDRVRKGAKQGTIVAVCTSATITIIILLFGKILMSLFTDTKELVELSYRMMTILAVGYVAMAVTQSLSGVMRGAGDTTTPMWISLITTVVIRVPIAYGLAYITKTPELPTGRSDSIFISLLISWILGAIITTLAYKMGKWHKQLEI